MTTINNCASTIAIGSCLCGSLAEFFSALYSCKKEKGFCLLVVTNHSTPPLACIKSKYYFYIFEEPLLKRSFYHSLPLNFGQKYIFFWYVATLSLYFFWYSGRFACFRRKKIIVSIKKASVFCAALPRGRQGSTSAVWWQWHSRYSLPNKHS